MSVSRCMDVCVKVDGCLYQGKQVFVARCIGARIKVNGYSYEGVKLLHKIWIGIFIKGDRCLCRGG